MDDDDKSSSVSGWATANSVGSTAERYQQPSREKSWVGLTSELTGHACAEALSGAEVASG